MARHAASLRKSARRRGVGAVKSRRMSRPRRSVRPKLAIRSKRRIRVRSNKARGGLPDGDNKSDTLARKKQISTLYVDILTSYDDHVKCDKCVEIDSIDCRGDSVVNDTIQISLTKLYSLIVKYAFSAGTQYFKENDFAHAVKYGNIVNQYLNVSGLSDHTQGMTQQITSWKTAKRKRKKKTGTFISEYED
jgi:hypothetical protein